MKTIIIEGLFIQLRTKRLPTCTDRTVSVCYLHVVAINIDNYCYHCNYKGCCFFYLPLQNH